MYYTVKIGFVNLLPNQVAQWTTVIIEKRAPALFSYDASVAELRRVFDHPVQGDEAWTKL